MSLPRMRATISSWSLGLATCLLAFTAAAESTVDHTSYSVEPLLVEIRARQSALDRRERDLEERERTYKELVGIVDSQLQEITALRDSLESQLEVWDSKGGERVRKLAKIYAAMPPGGAAQLVNKLDPTLATQVLSKMKPKKSAAILGRLRQDLAVTVSIEVAGPLGRAGNDTPSGGPR